MEHIVVCRSEDHFCAWPFNGGMWQFADGGSEDLGYPSTVLRADGSLVSTYCFNDAKDKVRQNGGARYIAATVWQV